MLQLGTNLATVVAGGISATHKLKGEIVKRQLLLALEQRPKRTMGFLPHLRDDERKPVTRPCQCEHVSRFFPHEDDYFVFLDVLGQAWEDEHDTAHRGYALAIEELIRKPSEWAAKRSKGNQS